VFGFRASYQPAQLVVPALKLAARELPAGAPQGFEQTVGSFSLSAKIEDSQLAAGDPANVTLTISGRGNMDSVRVPRLLDPNGWKVYDAVPRQRGQERRNLTGEVVFTQLIRPLQPKSLIPPFRMVYFDPEEELYKTLLTDPIKLELSAAPPGIGVQPQAPQARPVPAEQLGDILGIIEVSRGGTNSWAGQLPRWAWQIIPALIVLGLIGNFVGRRLARRFAKHPDVVAKRAALREVERAPGEAAGFYRAAGRFVEAWLGDDHAEEIAAIIAERDRVCFQPDGSEPAKLAGAQRRAVLRALRRHALVWVLAAAGLLATSGESLAADSANPYTEADKAYQQGRFAEAAKGFAAPHQERGDYPADVLYNIANCYYRLDQPGYAALFYRRALLVNPAHPEARQNLRYLEKSHGALVVPRSDTQQMLGVLGLHTWQSLTMLGGWLVAIGVLGLLLTRPGSPAKPTAIALLVIGPVLLLTGGLGWYYYPDDARFAPVERQAVVVAPDTMVRTAASRNAADVIMAPAGSLAEVVATRGRWTYLSFASKTRGWVPSDTVEPLVAPGPLELKSLAKPPVPPPPPLNLTPGA
jgi:tetratricopeptide (TPR) repeat protein